MPESPKKIIWFKAKKYGWGWYPATWQGWSILIGYLILIWFISPTADTIPAKFIFESIVITAILIYVCYKTGEKPRWRWGKD